MYQLYKEFNKEEISLAYLGAFTDNITSMLMELSDDYLSKQEKFKKVSKRASFLIAETFQNVVRHGLENRTEEISRKAERDFFQISVLSDRIIISSVNLIKENDARELNLFIENINSLDAKQLKALKQKMLMTSEMSKKGGAGLGIIEMVRKSGLPLQKKFVSLTDDISLVILSLELLSQKENKENIVDIDHVEEMYRKLSEENILMLYKGDFSSASNSNIISMLNDNFLKDGEIDPGKIKSIVAIIEMMQNISKHGLEVNGRKEGIFSLSASYSADKYCIACGNFIDQYAHDKLKALLEKIKNAASQDLEQMYKEKLAEPDTQVGNAGLGLLEIARSTDNPFLYDFFKIKDNYYFYTLKIKTRNQ